MMEQYETMRTGMAGAPHPVNIVVMMYDGSIDYLRKAVGCAERKDEKGFHAYTDKAQDIIQSLNSALDLDQGGEMAKNLETYYVIMNRILSKAKKDMDVTPLRQAMEMLSGVKESWEHVRDSVQVEVESRITH
jgi:flagellar secretion chaperone FliS